MFLKMWLWIITGLNIILSVHGFASGGFPQSCGSLLPQHGPAKPQSTEAPFDLSFEPDNNGDLFTVSLRSTDSDSFSGFMLEAREEGLDRPVGKFSQHGANRITLLNCDGSVASAVSQANNQPKRLFKVNWMPPTEGPKNNINLRATFTESFFTFWTNVTKPVISVPTPAPVTTTAQTTTQPKTTRTTTPRPSPQPPNLFHKKRATVLMVTDSTLLVMRMELSNIITNAMTNSHLSRILDRILKLTILVLSGAMEISGLGLKIAPAPPHATLIALVCVVIILTIVEIAITCPSLGPSHELKQICDLSAKVCSVVHEAFTIAFIYIGYLEIAGKNRSESATLWVLIAYTAWILLHVVWIFVMATQKHVILRRRKKVSSMNTQQRDGRKKERLPLAVAVIPITFIVGTFAFAAALIVGILQLP